MLEDSVRQNLKKAEERSLKLNARKWFYIILVFPILPFGLMGRKISDVEAFIAYLVIIITLLIPALRIFGILYLISVTIFL